LCFSSAGVNSGRLNSGGAGRGSQGETRKSVWCCHQKPCGDRYIRAHKLITRLEDENFCVFKSNTAPEGAVPVKGLLGVAVFELAFDHVALAPQGLAGSRAATRLQIIGERALANCSLFGTLAHLARQ